MLDQLSGFVEEQTSRLPNKCLHREDFVIVGWTDPQGSRPYLGALLLGYYTKDGPGCIMPAVSLPASRCEN
jgi:hypothetical protein